MELFGRMASSAKPRNEAVIDIGSHSIKALVFERGIDDAPPRVLKKMASHLPTSAERLRVAAKLHELMFFLVRETGGAPGKVTIAMGPYLADYSLASWPASEDWTKAAVSGSDLARMFLAAAGEHEEPARVLWAYPTAVFANGYALSASVSGSMPSIRFLPKARSGQGASLSFAALIASLPRRVAETLDEARFAWGGMPIEFIPLPLAYLHALGCAGETSDYLLIDTGGEETMLMRVRRGLLLSVRFFPVGSHEFIRAAARDKGISFREAENIMQGYSRGTARSVHGTQTSEVASDLAIPAYPGQQEFRAGSRWNGAFVRTLDEDYHLGPLSERVILTGGGAQLPEVEAAVRAGAWIQKLSHVSAPSVRILAGNNFFRGMSFAGSVDGPEDAGLAALMQYALRRTDAPPRE